LNNIFLALNQFGRADSKASCTYTSDPTALQTILTRKRGRGTRGKKKEGTAAMMDSLIHSNPPSRLEDTNPFPGKFKKLAGRPEEAMGEENM
jgi:hypothetical protein